VLGGGITNLIIQRIPKCQFRLITGMNLPLILALFTCDDEKLSDEKIADIIGQARAGIVDVGKMIEERRAQIL
jgi:mannose/fructose-specific phosphotransferase system component IIA